MEEPYFSVDLNSNLVTWNENCWTLDSNCQAAWKWDKYKSVNIPKNNFPRTSRYRWKEILQHQ